MRRGWLIWGLLLVAVFALGLLKRHLGFIALGESLAQRLTPVAEGGSPVPAADEWEDPELDDYLYGLYDYNSGKYTPPAQGACVFLFNRGYRNPKLMRAVLLTEARRCYDWQYTYSRVRNYDLRRGLMRQCLRLYPGDLRVAWACGQLDLAAGDWEEAREQLGRVIAEKSSMPLLRSFGVSIGRKGRNILGRYCAALTMCGREDEALALLRKWHQAYEQEEGVTWALSHQLLDSGQYRAVADLLGPADPMNYDAANPEDREFWAHYSFDAPIVYAAAQTGLAQDDAATLSEMQAQWQALLGKAPGPDAEWEQREQYSESAIQLAVDLASRLIKANRPGEAQVVLARVDTSMLWDDPLISDMSSLQFVMAVAGGGKLEPVGYTPGDYSYLEGYGTPGGPFCGMLDSEVGVATLRGPLFAAALKQRGVSFEEIKPELYAALEPQRNNYSNYYGGDLKPGAL